MSRAIPGHESCRYIVKPFCRDPETWIAYGMLEEDGASEPADKIGAMISSEGNTATAAPTDTTATGSVTLSN